MKRWEFFWIILKINAITFGGGYTIVPLLRNIFVKEKKIIKDDDMLQLIALAQSGPGAMAVSTSVLLGYKFFGKTGGFISLFASVLPPLITITLISMFYSIFRSNYYVNAALIGIGGVIAAVMFVTVFDMGKAAFKSHRYFSAFMFILAFILGYFFKINTSIIILILGAIGLLIFTLFNEEVIK